VFDFGWLNLLCIAVILGSTTVWSGVEYFIKNRDFSKTQTDQSAESRVKAM
jgi:hypothetical protein